MTLIQAIAQIEGYYASGPKPNRPQRNNNPGNLNWAPWLAANYGAVMETAMEPRFAKFKTEQDGFAAMHDLLAGVKYRDLTIEAAINRYAPPTENNTHGYVDFVCGKVGCKPTDLVKDVL